MSKLALLLLLCAALALAGVHAAAPFSASTRAHVVARLASSRASEAGGWGSAAATASAVQAYTRLGESVPNAAKLCATLNKELLAAVRGSKVQQAHSALTAAAELQCSGFTVPAPELKKLLQQALARKTVEDIFFATQSALALERIKGGGVSLSDLSSGLKGVDSTLLSLLEEDGTVRSEAEAEEGSAYHAGLALQTLGALAAKQASLVDKAVLRQFSDKASALLSTGVSADGSSVDFTNAAPSDVTPLEAVASVLSGLQSLSAAGEKPDAKKAQLVALAAFVSRSALVGDADDAAALAAALKFLSSNAVHTPLFLSVIEGSTPEAFTVKVTNALGQPVASKVELKVDSAKNMRGSGAAIKDLAFTAAKAGGEENAFVLTEAARKAFAAAAPGVYELRLTATPKGASSASSGYGAGSSAQYGAQSGLVLTRKVVSARRDALLQGATLEFGLTEGPKVTKGEPLAKASFPAGVPALQGAGASVDASKHLQLRVKLPASVTAAQRPSAVFLQLSSPARAALFVLRSADASSSDNLYTLSLPLGSSEVLDSLAGSGAYELALLVGDALAEAQSAWKLGQVTLTLPVASSAAAASTAAAAQTEEQLEAFFSPRPLIAHSFRAAEARSSVFVALLFSAALLGLFGMLLVSLLRAGLVNVRLPSNPTEFLYALVFQASIAAILLGYALYWLSLNIFQALALLAVCSVVAVFSGTGALRMLHQRAGAVKGHDE